MFTRNVIQKVDESVFIVFLRKPLALFHETKNLLEQL